MTGLAFSFVPPRAGDRVAANVTHAHRPRGAFGRTVRIRDPHRPRAADRRARPAGTRGRAVARRGLERARARGSWLGRCEAAGVAAASWRRQPRGAGRCRRVALPAADRVGRGAPAQRVRARRTPPSPEPGPARWSCPRTAATTRSRCVAASCASGSTRRCSSGRWSAGRRWSSPSPRSRPSRSATSRAALRTAVVPNGVAALPGEPCGSRVPRARSGSARTPGSRVFVGRLDVRHKGLDRLVAAPRSGTGLADRRWSGRITAPDARRLRADGGRPGTADRVVLVGQLRGPAALADVLRGRGRLRAPVPLGGAADVAARGDVAGGSRAGHPGSRPAGSGEQPRRRLGCPSGGRSARLSSP